MEGPGAPEWPPLLRAAKAGDAEAVEFLLRHQHDPNAFGRPYGTALMVVAGEKVHGLASKTAVVRALLRGGADPDLRNVDQKNRTALMHAAREGFAEAAEELLLGGAAPDLLDADGWSALHQAACRGQVDAIRVLLRHGARDSRHDTGQTALTLAANLAHGGAVDLLLDALDPPQDYTGDLTSAGLALLCRSERGRREACEASLREERAKVESFRHAIPHIVASAAAAGPNKRARTE